LEDDGIEDLHFYFVEFNLHKRLIMQQQKCRSISGSNVVRHLSSGSKGNIGVHALSKTSSVQQKTIESCDDELF
jgi:hypothetical protein